MQNYLLVFLGGGLGSICRLGIGQLLVTCRLTFPWATFLANFLACLALGLLIGFSLKGRLGDSVSVFLMAGFCGGFSTFSTFTNETFQMLIDGEWLKAGIYIMLSLFVCLVALYAGVRVVGHW